jgi:ubiquinone/menaquinone biosynthesis C-methylase UbiE
MLVKLLIRLCAISPAIRRMVWKYWYQKLAKQMAQDEWTFMNYGYASSGATGPDLDPADEPDRLCIQLYDRVITPANVADKKLLEVGSGRGGGSSYIARYLKPAHITGIDFSAQAVQFSTKRHQQEKLTFAEGDAESLPFPDNSFDAVLNVESSHCYGNVPKFFAEVARVLKPGGIFTFADLREPHEMDELRQQLSIFQILEEEEITANVAASLAADHARKQEQIERLAPVNLVKTFNEFAGLQGTQIFNNLSSRTLVYYRFAARVQ